MTFVHNGHLILTRAHQLNPTGWMPEARVLRHTEDGTLVEQTLLGDFPRASRADAETESILLGVVWINGINGDRSGYIHAMYP